MESKPDIYQTFSNIVLSQSSRIEDFHRLDEEQSILSPLLPTMIRNLCAFMEDPDFRISSSKGPYFFSHYTNLSSALQNHPNIPVKRMLPHEVFQFINSIDDSCLFDSENLGVSFVSKKPIAEKQLQGLVELTLEPFLAYALSNELWGPEGKWTRFHERMVNLLNLKSLLIKTSGPGNYLLNIEGKRIEKYGLKGTMKEDGYLLQMTWAYPLKALVELEKIISQEF